MAQDDAKHVMRCGSETTALANFDPSRMAAYWIKDVVYVLPRLESRPRWVRRVGASFAAGIGFRWSSIGLGVDLLKHGVLIMIGPVFVWIAHIERQLQAFDAIAMEARSGETEGLDPKDDSAGPQGHRPERAA